MSARPHISYRSGFWTVYRDRSRPLPATGFESPADLCSLFENAVRYANGGEFLRPRYARSLGEIGFDNVSYAGAVIWRRDNGDITVHRDDTDGLRGLSILTGFVVSASPQTLEATK